MAPTHGVLANELTVGYLATVASLAAGIDPSQVDAMARGLGELRARGMSTSKRAASRGAARC